MDQARPINWKRNLICAWIGQLLCIAGSSAILPFMPLFIREKYHVTDDKELGMWVAAMSFFGLCSYCFSTPVWGWLADRGFDFIQTDWLRDCADFLERTGRRTPT